MARWWRAVGAAGLSRWRMGRYTHDKLGSLLTLKYHTVIDAAAQLGSGDLIRDTFIGFQPQLFIGAQG